MTPSSDVSGIGPHRPTPPTTSPKASAGHSRCRVQTLLPAQTRLFIQARQLAALMFIPTLTLNDDASWESSPDVWDGRGKAPGRQTAGSSAVGGEGSWVWLGSLYTFWTNCLKPSFLPLNGNLCPCNVLHCEGTAHLFHH